MPTTKRDYYEILGVAQDASKEQIKRAYRAMALKYHPDRVSAEEKSGAEEKFKEMSEAYAVLSDPQKRQVYDQYGHRGFDQRFSTEDIFRGADFSSIFEGMGGGSIFEDLLGGLFGFGGSSRRGARQGADLEYELELEFEEAAKGVTKSITIPRREVCSECQGTGGDRTTCKSCQGRGQVRQSAGFMILSAPCASCRGQGSTLKRACARCGGEGRTQARRTLQVKVPAGIESGMRLRMTGEGEGSTGGRGDLYVLVTIKSHPVFERDGADLIVEYPVHIAQVALGTEIAVPTLNGRVSMKIPAGTQTGMVFRIRGKGLSSIRGGRVGDLLVRVTLETPTRLSASQRQLLEELGKTFETRAHPHRESFLSQVTRWVKGS